MRTNRLTQNGFLLAGFALVANCASLRAGPPEELLRLAPEKSAFCLIVRDLRAHSAELEAGPWLQAFRQSRLGVTLAASPEATKLREVAGQVAQQLHMELLQIRDEVFGDAIVFAYENGPPGHPEQENGVLLTWARDPKVAAQFIERVNEAQKASGELKELISLSHRSREYYRRVKSKGPDDYCFLHGSILAFSQQESAIRRAIDRDLDAALAADVPPQITKQLAKLKSDGALATLLVNPRSFDAELAHKLEAAKGNDAAFLRNFQNCWSAIESLGLTGRINKNLTVEFTAFVQKDALPPGMQRLIAVGAPPSDLTGRFPADCIATVVGRIDPGALVEAVGEFMTPDARQAMQQSLDQSLAPVFGKNGLPQVAKQIGPEWGICLSPPGTKSAVPRLLLALRVRPEGNAEQALLDALDVVSTFVRAGYNANHPEPIRVKKTVLDKVEVKYLECDSGFPPGFQPAYAVKHGYLLVASSPDAIAQFGNRGESSASMPSVYLSFRQLDRFLSEHGAELVRLASSGNKIDKADATHLIEQIQMGIDLLDRLEIHSGSAETGRSSVSLRLHFTKPLKK